MSVLDLNGVGDEKERKRLQVQVDRVIFPGLLWKMLPICCLGFAAIMTLIELRWIPASPAWWWNKHVVAFILWMPLMVLGHRWLDRDRKRAMVELLKCELRCTSCGYSLKATPGGTCPECGAPRPFPLTGRDAAISEK